MGDDRIINNAVIGFTGTLISLSDPTCKMVETLNFFNIKFINNENNFLSLSHGCRNDVAVLDLMLMQCVS